MPPMGSPQSRVVVLRRAIVLAGVALAGACAPPRVSELPPESASAGSGEGAERGIPASDIAWRGILGERHDHPSIMYSLMGRGYFAARTARDIDRVIEEWLRAHPEARVIPVAIVEDVSPPARRFRMTYVWVAQGEDNLNLHLVRRGCCPAETMASSMERIEVPRVEFNEFLRNAGRAEEQAKSEKVGIWAAAR
ncbi:MAG: hypothetical protein HY716_15655 [Planctomycetes bacterium]|nr:hypothetical protein [Planctomycetota bacterium]